MESYYLKTILTVIETGSFSRAAASLCITQSAVSHRVKFLEDRFGCQLIDRSGPELIPTEAGHLVMQKGKQIILLENTLESEIKQLGQKMRLSLCCTPTFGIVYLPKIMNKYFLSISDNIDIKVTLKTPEPILKGLLENDFDIGVIEHTEDLNFSGFKTYALPLDQMVFISSRLIGEPGMELSLDELTKERLIARYDGCSCRKLLDANLEQCSLDFASFKNTVVYDDLQLTIETALAGGGIAFVSKCLVKEYLQKGLLFEHRVKGFQHTRLRTAVLHENKQHDTNIRLFLDYLFDIFNISQPST